MGIKKNKNLTYTHSGGQLLHILHIADPTLPVGGFSHSNGLETYVQQGLVKDVQSTIKFIKAMLENNYKYNDGFLVSLAHAYTSAKDIEKLVALDIESHALKSPMEIREASVKMGTRLLKIYIEFIDSSLLEEFQHQVKEKSAYGYFPVVYGLITALLEIPMQDAIASFLYNATVAMMTNAVKLVPLGQMDGQRILFGTHTMIQEVTKDILNLDLEMLGLCNPAFDIRSMQHENLYSRLYMS
ncbi:urease accessory protein UreF [Echinicola sp. CAU 1574]|uniref:Urease accessory protein UreF n=1 Tax=Echinicola arenosa TaxID=2774144 RepID=A0ABR9APB3_9BACT|nr:urease accessory protein UreF [Echinicola arenosa]MBD8490632.1 urease accessory protein UreF [Echinicola arenosa]